MYGSKSHSKRQGGVFATQIAAEAERTVAHATAATPQKKNRAIDAPGKKLRDTGINHDVVDDGAQHDENVKDFVAPEIRIMASGPFQGVHDTAERVKDAAAEEPKDRANTGVCIDKGKGSNADPTKGDIDAGGQFARHVNPAKGKDATDEGERPNRDKKSDAKRTGKPSQTNGRISPRDETINGGMIHFSQ